MTWFVDASALVALATREPEWTHLSKLMDEEEQRIWSPVSRWESVAAATVRLKLSVATAERLVDELADTHRFALVPIGRPESDLALDAWQRYGKVAGHPARLNMGDCFAYACARTNHARLLYKGDDFSHTDLALT